MSLQLAPQIRRNLWNTGWRSTVLPHLPSNRQHSRRVFIKAKEPYPLFSRLPPFRFYSRFEPRRRRSGFRCCSKLLSFAGFGKKSERKKNSSEQVFVALIKKLLFGPRKQKCCLKPASLFCDKTQNWQVFFVCWFDDEIPKISIRHFVTEISSVLYYSWLDWESWLFC